MLYEVGIVGNLSLSLRGWATRELKACRRFQGNGFIKGHIFKPTGNATQANSIFPFYHRSSVSTVSDMSRSESSNLSREESCLSLEPLFVHSISRSSSERSGTGARDVLVSPLGETTEFLPIKVIAPDMQADILGLLNPIFEDYHKTMVKIRSRWVGACNSHTKLISRSFTDWLIFSIPSLLWKKGSSRPVTRWRQTVSCDWSWHSHGCLIPGKFDLKINLSVNSPWQEYRGVASAPLKIFEYSISCRRGLTRKLWGAAILDDKPNSMIQNCSSFYSQSIFRSIRNSCE